MDEVFNTLSKPIIGTKTRTNTRLKANRKASCYTIEWFLPSLADTIKERVTAFLLLEKRTKLQLLLNLKRQITVILLNTKGRETSSRMRN